MSNWKYQINCVTEGQLKYWNLSKDDPTPTKCPTDTNHEVELSSVALIQRGPPSDKFDSDGNLVVTPTFEYDGDLNGVWKGYSYTAPPGVLSFFEEEVVTEVKLRGGWYQLIAPTTSPQANKGDYLEFSVIDRNDVLGYFAAFGLIVGNDILELKRAVKTDFINPFNNSRQEFMATGASTVVAGLFFRTSYFNTGVVPVDFKVTLKYHEP